MPPDRRPVVRGLHDLRGLDLSSIIPAELRRLASLAGRYRDARADARNVLARFVAVLALSVAAMWTSQPAVPNELPPLGDSEPPEIFSHEELVRLTYENPLGSDLKLKLDRLLRTPVVDNSAHREGIRPVVPTVPELGPSLRVASWNVARGGRLDDLAVILTGVDDLAERSGREQRRTSAEFGEVVLQRGLLRDADVLVIQEVDWGLERTGYRNVAGELAESLGMNWTYGVQFVEVDPVNLGIDKVEPIAVRGAEDRNALPEAIEVDLDRHRGLHGLAILSRYPIEGAELVPLQHQGHDWYRSEVGGVSILEDGRRMAIKRLFRTEVTRQVRHGGRTLLVAHLEVPRLPEGRLTVAAVHLEDRAGPEDRHRQMQEILRHLEDVENPVILAGDLNTSGTDGTPTSLRRELTVRLKSEEFWVKTVARRITPMGWVEGLFGTAVNFFRSTRNPTVRHIPFVAANPEAKLFSALERFRFTDGGAFDFRGDPERSSNGRGGKLANSNERARLGFAGTFEADRTLGPAGKFKLDWILVKSYITDPRDPRGPYRFAPHHGRTLTAANEFADGRISDHAPLTVDLPFAEPDTGNR